MFISVVIPAYNEEKIIAKVISEIKDQVSQVIVVNDGSSDQTADLARQAGAEVLSHIINRGQGAAIQTGLNFALKQEADIIITFDADGQHDSNDISQLIAPLLLGEVDVALGSRFLNKNNQIPILKIVVLKLATWFTRLYTGLRVTDTHNGLRAFSRLAAESIKINQAGMAHASEIIEEIKKNNLKFKEIPVTIRYTDYSLQKGQKISNSFRIVWDLILGKISK